MKAAKPRPPARRKRSIGWALLGAMARFVLYLAPFVIAAGVAYFGYVDRLVREQFEGKRWALPASHCQSPRGRCPEVSAPAAPCAVADNSRDYLRHMA